MSDYVNYSGKLTELVRVKTDEQLETICKEYCEKEGIELSKWDKNYTDLVISDVDEIYIHKKPDMTIVYSLDCKKFDDVDDYFRHTVSDDGTISFETRFYDGGTCLNEMIGENLV